MKFRYYLAISIIIHIIFVLNLNLLNNKDELLGEKLAPIEILNNQSFKVQGGNFKENSKKLKKKIKPEKTIEKKIEKKAIDNKKNFKETNNDVKKLKEGNLEINEAKKKKEKKEKKVKNKTIDKKKISDPLTSENKKKGISTGKKKGENEKGSIKGKGKLKITCLKCITPDYPQRALRRGLEGKPLIQVRILTNGTVEKASILRSSGITEIDNAALKAAAESVFYPIEYDSSLKIEYDLKLK